MGAEAGTTAEAGAGGVGTNEPPPPASIHFVVDATKEVHAISPLIYGADAASLACDDAKARFTFCRHHSPAWSTYNWENNASNAGVNGCNENNAALSASDTPGAAVTSLIDKADAVDAATVVTLPMLDYVAIDKLAGTPKPACSGDVMNTANYLSTRFAQNRARKGAPLSTTPDTGDGLVAQDEFVAFLADQYADSPLLFSLDTQPELWSDEHPRVHPAKLDYDDEVSISVDYATMIKDTWPSAPVVGLVGWGYLAAVSQQKSPDYLQKGEFFSYFLQHIAEASQTAGRRLIDYVDLHWFPEIAPNGKRIIDEFTDSASVAARVQAPRSLWDPNFVEDSWVAADNGGEPIELITWLSGAIADNYPGTKLALSEWTFGGGKHISGAVAAADALGIFGQKSVGMAGAISFSPDDEPYLVGAFEAFRNYDGQGSAFGDTSVSAASDDVAHGTIYASVDQANPKRMVLVAINRYAAELTASLAITSDASYTSVTPYVISDGQPDPVKAAAIAAIGPNSFSLTLPAYTVTVLVPSE